jgi:hypothetical protein
VWSLARRRGRVWAFILFGVVERLGNQLSGTFADLAGALDRAHAHILAALSSALADVFGRASRMQRHEVAGPFPDALGSLACALACAFIDIAAAPADITAGAWGWVAGLDWVDWGCVAGA